MGQVASMAMTALLDLTSSASVRTGQRLTISVVMPIKDRFDLAATAMEAVLNQTLLVDEMIVVDDESQTSAEEHFNELKVRMASRGIAIRFLRNDANRGVSASRNLGFKASRGDIVCFCDSDDFWLPQKVEQTLDVFQSNKVHIQFHAFHWAYGTLAAFKLLPHGRLMQLPRFVLVMFAILNPSCMSLRRGAFGAGYDESMRYHEDLDFVLTKSEEYVIHFFNFPLTMMGRPPGSIGGATQNRRAMRAGAIQALQKMRGSAALRFIALAKIAYHQFRMFGTR